MDGSNLRITTCTPVIGAEVSGVDLRQPLDTELAGELHRLLVHHRVLFFRDQQLNTVEQIAFAQALGPIQPIPHSDPEHPGVRYVEGSTVGWHIDASSLPHPPAATVLRAVELPPSGGDTLWASAVAAYHGLPERLKAEIHGKYATHSGGQREPDTDRPLIAHPLVRTHQETGERYLYINFAPWENTHIIGLGETESTALVEQLRTEYLRPEHQVRFHWSPGAIAVWDNRVVQHTGTKDYADHPRRMARICLERLHRSAAG